MGGIFLKPIRALALGCLFFGGVGCGYYTESERAYYANREAERLQQQDQRNALVATLPNQEVLDLVYETDAPDGIGKTKGWATREVEALSGQVLFPQWLVARRGASRYEVRFTYTFIDATNKMARRGYAWTVDTALKLVDAPVPIVLSAPVQMGRNFEEKNERRVQDEEESLE